MNIPEYVGSLSGRNTLNTQEFSQEELNRILDAAEDLKERFIKGEKTDYLPGRTLFLMFYNRSLRTRNSFEAGIHQLGGHANFLSPQDVYTPTLPEDMIPYKTESISDVSRVLSRYGDGIAIRIYGEPAKWTIGRGNQIIKEFEKWADVPVLNMEDDIYHPFQALADMMTAREAESNLEGKKFVVSYAYSGGLKPLAVPQSLTLAATHFGMDVTLAHPEGFELEDTIIKDAEKNADRYGGDFNIINDMEEAFEGADFVYPKAWSPRQFLPPYSDEVDKKGATKYQSQFQDWIVDMDLMNKTNDAYYMHCGPADRGQEVTDEVIDEYDNSLYFDEAENRLHAQKAIMAMTMI